MYAFMNPKKRTKNGSVYKIPQVRGKSPAYCPEKCHSCQNWGFAISWWIIIFSKNIWKQSRKKFLMMWVQSKFSVSHRTLPQNISFIFCHQNKSWRRMTSKSQSKIKNNITRCTRLEPHRSKYTNRVRKNHVAARLQKHIKVPRGHNQGILHRLVI